MEGSEVTRARLFADVLTSGAVPRTVASDQGGVSMKRLMSVLLVLLVVGVVVAVVRKQSAE